MDKYQTTFETWDKLSLQYQKMFMELDIYNDSYDLFCDTLKSKNASVFEIGCGPGNVTKYLFEKRPDIKIKAIDVAPTMINLARKNVPKADFSVMDCRALHVIEDRFDGIICAFCMPYLSKEDCAKLIQDCSLLLKSNGTLYFSCIEGDSMNSGFESGSTGDSTYVYYHSIVDLKTMLISSGFDLAHELRINYEPAQKRTQTHLIVMASKRN